MRAHVIWPIALVLAAGVVALGLGSAAGQRPGAALPGYFVSPYRFVVAYGAVDRVIVLDSATGQVYKAMERDFKPMSELPKVGGEPALEFPGKDAKKGSGKGNKHN